MHASIIASTIHFPDYGKPILGTFIPF